MARKYRYFSADSHYESLPESWTHRVPAKYRDRAPRRIKLADGRDAIVDEGQPLEYRAATTRRKHIARGARRSCRSFADGVVHGCDSRTHPAERATVS